MKISVNIPDLDDRIALNSRRLRDGYYQMPQVFSPAEYDWPGDKEGRALLAFCSHYRMTKEENPCLAAMSAAFPERTNADGYFGPLFDGMADEQQLSSHNWVLRGLLEHYLAFGDSVSLDRARAIVHTLYAAAAPLFAEYEPSSADEGAVSGTAKAPVGNWRYSTDVGCAFMSIDGLSQYYEITGDPAAMEVLTAMLPVFRAIDIEENRLQTHCCLTAARGLVRLWQVTGDADYLREARRIHRLYAEKGMTDTYHNFNWWGRKDTWTEPCAVVDSLMLSLELYKADGDEACRRLAAQIWHNAFPSMQVGNGGAGPTSTVYENDPYLYTSLYEAPFCCTMRLAEGLRYVKANADLLYATDGPMEKDDRGRYRKGDILYAEIESAVPLDGFLKTEPIFFDGHRLVPLLPYYRLPKEVSDGIRQRVRF